MNKCRLALLIVFIFTSIGTPFLAQATTPTKLDCIQSFTPPQVKKIQELYKEIFIGAALPKDALLQITAENAVTAAVFSPLDVPTQMLHLTTADKYRFEKLLNTGTISPQLNFDLAAQLLLLRQKRDFATGDAEYSESLLEKSFREQENKKKEKFDQFGLVGNSQLPATPLIKSYFHVIWNIAYKNLNLLTINQIESLGQSLAKGEIINPFQNALFLPHKPDLEEEMRRIGLSRLLNNIINEIRKVQKASDLSESLKYLNGYFMASIINDGLDNAIRFDHLHKLSSYSFSMQDIVAEVRRLTQQDATGKKILPKFIDIAGERFIVDGVKVSTGEEVLVLIHNGLLGVLVIKFDGTLIKQSNVD